MYIKKIECGERGERPCEIEMGEGGENGTQGTRGTGGESRQQ
jgi:hypothetical protein